MSKRKESTIAALLKEKKKRGRPRRAISRRNVYVALSQEDKQQMSDVASKTPDGLGRADVPDMAISLLSARLELLRRAVADRDREIPEGITDLESLYLLWDLPLPNANGESQWTSIRLSPQQAIELGRAHGLLKVLFGVNRSQVFSLSLALLEQFVDSELMDKRYSSLHEVDEWIARIYL